MERRDWVLLVIAATGGEALSPVQLQKSLFLIGKNCNRAVGRHFYKFVPYNYGPFNATIYSDAEELDAEGLVTINRLPGQRWIEYAATTEGLARARSLEKDLPQDAVNYLHRVVPWARSLSFSQLIRAIYSRYPEYRAKSVFQD